MSTISIRLPNDLLKEADKRARELRIPRAEYVRRAIEHLNAEVVAEQRCRHRNAVPTIASSSAYSGCHSNISFAFDASATSTGGSPARRGWAFAHRHRFA